MAKKPFVPFWKKFGKDKDGEEDKPKAKTKTKKFSAGGKVRGFGCATKGHGKGTVR